MTYHVGIVVSFLLFLAATEKENSGSCFNKWQLITDDQLESKLAWSLLLI